MFNISADGNISQMLHLCIAYRESYKWENVFFLLFAIFFPRKYELRDILRSRYPYFLAGKTLSATGSYCLPNLQDSNIINCAVL